MKIVVLAGGLSPERDVSLSSGALIANALMETGHAVMLLDLFLGTDHLGMAPQYRTKQSGYQYQYTVPEAEPDLSAIRASVDTDSDFIGDGVIGLCKEADIVFLGLHGSVGENGQLQAMLDLYGIRYTGTGYAGSLLAMDKDISKRLLRGNGILTPDWHYGKLSQEVTFQGVSYPCVVKPCNCGSSVGVTVVENPAELERAVAYAKKYEEYVLIEEKIEGREFSVGILDEEALPVIEIQPLSGFYDYKNKYQQGLTREICPALLPQELEQQLQQAALAVHRTLRLGFYSRVDFILDRNNQAYCLEANTLPGMTPTSLLPQEAAAAGISYEALCDKIALSANCANAVHAI